MNDKIIFLLAVALFLSFSTVHAETTTFPKVYHVYVSGEHIGTVGDKEIVESFLNEQIEKEEKNYDGLNLGVNENITYISEYAFEPTFNNEKVLNQLLDNVTFSVQAQKLIVGEEEIGYFKNKETIKELLTAFQSKYMNEKQLKQAQEENLLNTEVKEDEENASSNEKTEENNEKKDQKELSAGDAKIVEVSLSEDIHIEEEQVQPNELLTVEQGLKLLEKDTSKEKVHIIQKGEALRSVANEYDLSMDEIFDLNPDLDSDQILQVGQEVQVMEKEPVVNLITVVEEVKEEAIDFETEYKKTSDLYVGEQEVKQQGKKGKKKVRYKLEKQNGKVTKRTVVDEEVLEKPVDKLVLKGTKSKPSVQSSGGTSGSAREGSGQFQWPAAGGIITSYMGPRGGGYHSGIDISGVSNRTIYAAAGGVVTTAGYQNNGYGNRVVIKHKNGYKTTYSHLSSISVNSGQNVKKGQPIGVMGETGNSTGVHLHFEILSNGSYINPMSYY